jgi:hypothetical protein
MPWFPPCALLRIELRQMRQNFLTRRRAVWVDAVARSPLFPRSSLSDPRKVASARFPASTQATGSLAAFFRGLKTAHPAGNDCTDGRCVSIDEGCGCRKRRHRVLRFHRVISIAKHGAARGLGCKLPSPRVKQNTAQRHNSLSGGGVIHIEPRSSGSCRIRCSRANRATKNIWLTDTVPL